MNKYSNSEIIAMRDAFFAERESTLDTNWFYCCCLLIEEIMKLGGNPDVIVYRQENVAEAPSISFSSQILDIANWYASKVRYNLQRTELPQGHYDEGELDELTREQLLNIAKHQASIIESLERRIYDKNVMPSNSSGLSSSDDVSLIQFVLRKRSGAKVAPSQSNIELREDANIVEDGKQGNFRHTVLDFMRVIYALRELEFFTEFNPNIDTKNNGVADLQKQKKAKTQDVFDAFGHAVNIEDLYKKYVQGFPKQASQDPRKNSKRKAVYKEEVLEIFDRMKECMMHYCDERCLESKPNDK